MPAWFVRISGVFAYTAAAVLAVWTSGLPAGVAYPVPGLVPLAWIVVGLVWLRVLALLLWRADESYGWFPRRGKDEGATRPSGVSLEKGPDRPRRQRPGLFRRLATSEYDSVPWVYLRQSLVWLLVVFAVVALGVLGRSHTSQHARALVQAGAAHATATVVKTGNVSERRGDEDAVTGYYATLVLAVPENARIRVEGAFTDEKPELGSRVDVLWAPTAPELGGLVEEGRDMERYLDRDWELTLLGLAFALFPLLFVLTIMLPTAIGAEADSLHEQAWSPLTQIVHATVVTGCVLLALPFLSGTSSGGGIPLGVAGIGLLALYITLPIRALIA